jgi:ornithine--oxo-acid transaminase
MLAQESDLWQNTSVMGYVKDLINEHRGENYSLHASYINPQFAKVLHYIGFDRIFARAQGPFLFDENGSKYLDCICAYGTFNIGRNHPRVKEEIKEILDLDLPNLVKMGAPLLSGLLAKELINIAPEGLDKVYFGNSGTEAVETALKYARCATGRPRLLFCHGAFHGLTLGALSVNGDHHFRDGFGELFPGCTEVPFNDLEALEREVSKGDVAGFIFESIQGHGVHLPHPDYLKEAEKICRKHKTIFIADEVAHGLGRTGKWFGFEHFGVSPDMVLVAKSLSGGFIPVSAVLAKTWIYEKVFSTLDRCVVHSTTFGQNNLAMAVGLVALRILKEEKLVENAHRRGKEIREGLRKIAAQGELIKEVRGKGLMIGVEFGSPKSLKTKMGWTMLHGVNQALFAQAIIMTLLSEERILSQVPGHGKEVIRFLPALCIQDAEVEWILQAMERTMREAHRFPGAVWGAGKTLAKLAMKNVFHTQPKRTS